MLQMSRFWTYIWSLFDSCSFLIFWTFVGPGFAVLNPWAQILEAQPLVGSGSAVLEPGFAMEKLPHETLGANPRSPTSSGLSTRSGSAVAKPSFAVERLPRETFGANPRSLVCHCKRQPPCKRNPTSSVHIKVELPSHR